MEAIRWWHWTLGQSPFWGLVLEYLSGVRINCQKWTERPRNLLQWIKNAPKNWFCTDVVCQKNGGRGLIRFENSKKSGENSLGRYVKNNIEPLLVAVRTGRTVTHEKTVDLKEFKKTKEEQWKNEWIAKRNHEQFARDIEDQDKSSTWRWIRKSDLKGCTYAVVCSAPRTVYTN